MGFISDFGIASARPMAVLAALSLAAAAPTAAQAPATTSVTVEIVGLRDSNGLVRLCLTRYANAFPKCQPATAMTATIKAGRGPLRHVFTGVPHGTYAIAAFHDANGNGKLDTMLGMPREGFAFSRNPPIKPRAPRFNETSFDSNSPSLAPLRMKYLL